MLSNPKDFEVLIDGTMDNKWVAKIISKKPDPYNWHIFYVGRDLQLKEGGLAFRYANRKLVECNTRREAIRVIKSIANIGPGNLSYPGTKNLYSFDLLSFKV